jgi:protein phosphatase
MITTLDSSDVLMICHDVAAKFAKTPTLITLTSPVVVFGDIHGHTLDLARFYDLFINNKKYSQGKFLFLGDLVDRGSFALESCLIIFLLILLYPDQVYSIRGNHEFDVMCREHGFYAQVLNSYPDEKVYHGFIEAFDQMPFGCKIDQNIICLHGGITQNLFSVDQVKRFPRPYHDFSNKLIDDILWGDPDDDARTPYKPSDRGYGYFFAEEPLAHFLTDNHLDLLVRAHECVESGCKYSLSQKCLTVFSASNYCGVIKNKAGVLIVESPHVRRTEELEALPYIQRENVPIQNLTNHLPFSMPGPSIETRISQKKMTSNPSRVRGLTLTPF